MQSTLHAMRRPFEDHTCTPCGAARHKLAHRVANAQAHMLRRLASEPVARVAHGVADTLDRAVQSGIISPAQVGKLLACYACIIGTCTFREALDSMAAPWTRAHDQQRNRGGTDDAWQKLLATLPSHLVSGLT